MRNAYILRLLFMLAGYMVFEEIQLAHGYDSQVKVNCGCHFAESCAQCGTHPEMCNGDCLWKGSKCVSETGYSEPGVPKTYCQPGQTCWPTHNETKAFSGSINGSNISCLGLPKFVSRHDADFHNISIPCLPYNGLLNNIKNEFLGNDPVGGDLNVCKSKKQSASDYLEPNPDCNSNPYITGAYYEEGSDDQIACMTPYQYLTNRNYKEEWMPAFIVTANTTEDVKKALNFSNHHNLGVAVMSTGHDLQDRNGGPGPNSLLIRTTCFRDFKANITANITDYKNKKIGNWTEGYATVGAGLTFGKNYWYNVTNAEGLYPLAYNVGREIVGGSCHTVGIVGWTLGGGKGWTTPMYGLGVDQLLHVDLVLANGTCTSANYTHNTELFKALRGGGPGFGVITSLKIKLHKPVCGTMKDCYSFWNTSWVGNWTGTEEQIGEIKSVLNAILDWKATYILYWNAFLHLTYYPESKTYNLNIGAGHFGTKEMNETNFNSFATALKNLSITNANHSFNSQKVEINPKPVITDKYFCEIFPNQGNTSDCYSYPWVVQRWSQYIRFLVNSETTFKKTTKHGKETNKFVDKLMETWQPLCDKQPYSACTSGFQFHYFFTYGNKTYNTGGSISPGFRDAAVEVYNSGVNSNKLKMTFEQKEAWMHYSLAPAMYEFSNASYISEAEYTLNPGQWEDRFWGKEIYAELLRIKEKYDPEYRLNCRHCVGSKI